MRTACSPSLVLGAISLVAGAIACSGSKLADAFDSASSSAAVGGSGASGNVSGNPGPDGKKGGGGGGAVGIPSEAGSETGSPPTGASRIQGIVRATLETCVGPDNIVLQYGESGTITCPASAPLGGDDVFIVPEMFIPGNGCIVASDKPHVIVVGNQFAVTATFTNPCSIPATMVQGGLAWMRYDRGAAPEVDGDGGSSVFPSDTLFDGVSSGTFQSCTGSGGNLGPNEESTLTCVVSSPAARKDLLVTPQMFVPGNGCIVSDGPPRVMKSGDGLAVTTTLRNRCGTPQSKSEGGIAWMVFARGTGTNQRLTLANLTEAKFEVCAGPETNLGPGGMVNLTCDVSAPFGGSGLLITPEVHVPGNGCVVASTLPTTVMIGNQFAVTTTLLNRCATASAQSEGGLGWISWRQ